VAVKFLLTTRCLGVVESCLVSVEVVVEVVEVWVNFTRNRLVRIVIEGRGVAPPCPRGGRQSEPCLQRARMDDDK
jgi:hypothetical protein